MKTILALLFVALGATAQQCVTWPCSSSFPANCSELDQTNGWNNNLSCPAIAVISTASTCRMPPRSGLAAWATPSVRNRTRSMRLARSICSIAGSAGGEYWSLWIYEYGSGAIYAYNGCMSSSAIALQFSDDGANSAYQAEQANCDNMNAAVVSSAVSGQTACLQGCSSQGQ